MTKCLVAALAIAVLAPGISLAAMKDDAVTSTTSYGPGAFIQSIEAFRHFMRDTLEQSYFSKLRDEKNADDPEERPVKPVAPKPSHFSWDLGYTFNSTTTPGTPATPTSAAVPDITDATHSFLGGLDWEILPYLDIAGEANVDSIPAENYRHGRIALKAEYTRSLYRDPKGISEEDADEARIRRLRDERDARTYYQRHSESYREEQDWLDKSLARNKRRSVDQASDDDDDGDEDGDDGGEGGGEGRGISTKYPLLKVALNVEFNKHLKQPLADVRIPALQQPTGNIFLDQYGEGLEVTYERDERWTYKLDGMFWYYGQDVNKFYQFLEGNVGTRKAQRLVASTGIGSLSNQLTSFPFLTFDETATRSYNDRFSLDLALNETFYKIDGIPLSLTFSPTLEVQMDKKWAVNPGFGLTYQGGSFEFMGIVGLVYSW